MSLLLTGLKVAILVTSGFAEVEMTKSRTALQEAGAIVHIVSPDGQTVKGWDCDIPAITGEFTVDVLLAKARACDYDALQELSVYAIYFEYIKGCVLEATSGQSSHLCYQC